MKHGPARRRLAALWLLAALLTPLPAQAAKVDRLLPAGGQRGTDVEVTLTGQRLQEPLGLLLSQPGIEVVAWHADQPDRCRATLRIGAACALGRHALRLCTPAGLGNLCTFHVGALREVQENRKGADAQALELDCTVNGAIAGEEQDRYTVAVAAGTRVVCEVEAMRLCHGPIDLQLSVLDPAGRELARVDDTPFAHKDPWLEFVAATAGSYELQLRSSFADAANEGPYRLHVGTFPRPVAALPCGDAPGAMLQVSLLGSSPMAPMTVELPQDDGEFWLFHPQDARGIAPTPLRLRLGGPPETRTAGDGSGPQRLELPASASGAVAAPHASVQYVFQAKKGVELELRVLARALFSPLDPLLLLHGSDGRVLASDDDGGVAGDCLLRFSPPADGDYTAEVRDLLGDGSPSHVFRLEAAARARTPRCRLVVGRGQEPVLNVPQGGSAAVVLQLDDADPEAGLALRLRALPDGVTAAFGPVARGSNLVPLVLTAAAEAPLQATWVQPWLAAEQPPKERSAGFAQVMPLVAVRNDQPILTFTERRLPVAVTRPAPFAVELETPAMPLVRGARLPVTARVKRSDGFKEPVRLTLLWAPPGVTGGEVVAAADAAKATFTLDAGDGAQLGAFPLALLASTGDRNAPLVTATPFAQVQVDKPWVVAKPQNVRATAGSSAALPFTLQPQRDPPVPCRVRLLGLPKGVTATEVEVPATATSGSVPLVLGADAAIGRHRDLVLELLVPQPGGDVLHRFGGCELRIDAAPAPAASTPAGDAGASTGEARR